MVYTYWIFKGDTYFSRIPILYFVKVVKVTLKNDVDTPEAIAEYISECMKVIQTFFKDYP